MHDKIQNDETTAMQQLRQKKVLTISDQIVRLGRRLVTANGILQIAAMSAMALFFAYKDAADRGHFLAQSNQNSLGLMLATGDLFQLRSVISSFKTNDTPKIWLLDDQSRDVLVRRRKPEKTEQEIGPHFQIENGSILFRAEFPIIYNNVPYGKLVLLNKIKLLDWTIMNGVILLLTLFISITQVKLLERFSLRLATGIYNLKNYFNHATSNQDIQRYSSQRPKTDFFEVEAMASEMSSLLSEILNAGDIEREKEKYKTMSQIASHVAHDLRHPISVIDTITRIIDWKAFEALRPELIRALSRVEDMIEGLRNSDSERFFKLIPDELDLNLIASDVRPAVVTRHAIIRCEGDGTLLKTLMDQSKLVRAF